MPAATSGHAPQRWCSRSIPVNHKRWNLRQNGAGPLVSLRAHTVSDAPGELVFCAAPGHNPQNDGISRRDPSRVNICVAAAPLDDALPLPHPSPALLKIEFWELIESSGKLAPFDPAAKQFCNCLAARSLPALLASRL